jgi:hypothetical protein
MKPACGRQVSGGLKLLWNAARMYALHVGTYLVLMVVAVLALLLMSLFSAFVITRDLPGKNLGEVWMGMSTLQKSGIIAMFFGSLSVFYRALAASILATSEFCDGHEIRALQAFRGVHWKHTRLFWLMMLAVMSGPFAPVVALIAGFFFASAFPTAVVEDLGAFQALKRGEKLAVGNQLRIATMYVTYLVVLVGVGLGVLKALVFIQDHFGRAWYSRPLVVIGYLVFFSVVQWYMIVLTLNYLEQRRKLTEIPPPGRDVVAAC